MLIGKNLYPLVRRVRVGITHTRVPVRGGHFFTINRKPNRTVPNRIEISVRFRFLYLRSSVFGIVIGFHRIPYRNTKKPEYQTLSILKFDYLIM
jgi:hypothetical protein